ncbi:SulP family inorganic anion transporter [Halobacillus shinanisalinarum]|uniref:SulP family inorganic anion transporter n=1 Tax=Halobacillus shinanisalinarum TaxID=2932258 RepID=A0ABY4GVZ6_9BACI|nr:SulP family inorganic anion transporter [Halobacillus shinanisalinarum]UOQ92337.1 SulP family inorganic anion transporter [Halobacillus shinanisalinarum]
MLYKLLPGTKQLIHYNPSYLSGDITAGTVVALLLIPQSMAYAMIAGVPIALGLYAAIFPLLIYALFGSSRYLSVGPVSIVSLLAFSSISSIAKPNSPLFLELIIFLGLIVGVIHLVMGLIRLGSLFDYVSPAVISGFTSAAAIIIALNQVKSILGVSLPSFHSLIGYISDIFHKLPKANAYTISLGLGSLLLLFVMKRKFPASVGPFFVIIVSIMIVYYFQLDRNGVEIVGEIPQGLPNFSISIPTLDTLQSLLPVAFMIACISFAESYAIAKALANKEKEHLDSNQELIGLGMGNITSAFVGSIPVAGAISRTAVNHQSGAKSNLSLIVTALLMLIALLYLTPLLYYLPNATLAAIIITAVSSLINFKQFTQYLEQSPLDFLTFLTTFLTTLTINIFIGLVTGIVLSLLLSVMKRIGWRS